MIGIGGRELVNMGIKSGVVVDDLVWTDGEGGGGGGAGGVVFGGGGCGGWVSGGGGGGG